MDQAIAWLSKPEVLMALLAVFSLLLLVNLIVSLVQRRSFSRRQRDDIEMLMQITMQKEASISASGRVAEREALLREVRVMSDSLMQYVTELGRSQQQQADSFRTQATTSQAANEERMNRMREQIETRLAAYNTQMEGIITTLDDKLNINERRLIEMRQTLDSGMLRLQGENERKLEQIRVTVDEKLNSTLDKRLGESFRTVSERLEQVYRGLGEMQNLAAGVGDLKRVLSGVKTRGIWGEVQLGALLEQVLTPGQYESNVIVVPGATERVEYAVKLPGSQDEPVYLPIDAKFPAEDYQRLQDAEEAGDKQAADIAARALENAIRTEARRIHDKYIAPPHTTDFAVMFLPVEGLFAEVLRRPGIVESLQTDYRVVVTGPTTLLALLNSLQMGFRTIAIERRSSEVWELLGGVRMEFSKFSTLLVKTQKRLKQASDSIDIAARKTRTIERKLKNVQMLPSETDDSWDDVFDDGDDFDDL